IQLDLSDSKYCVSQRQWMDLTNVFCSGGARHLELLMTYLSVLGDNAFVVSLRCWKHQVILRGFRGELLSDAALRWCAASGVLKLEIWLNMSVDEHTLSVRVMGFWQQRYLTTVLTVFAVCENRR
ncbi:hypothetical protein AAVH_42085, partial [Aphelenchoides avenae]